jgi:hypothetical protein
MIIINTITKNERNAPKTREEALSIFIVPYEVKTFRRKHTMRLTATTIRNENNKFFKNLCMFTSLFAGCARYACKATISG